MMQLQIYLGLSLDSRHNQCPTCRGIPPERQRERQRGSKTRKRIAMTDSPASWWRHRAGVKAGHDKRAALTQWIDEVAELMQTKRRTSQVWVAGKPFATWFVIRICGLTHHAYSWLRSSLIAKCLRLNIINQRASGTGKVVLWERCTRLHYCRMQDAQSSMVWKVRIRSETTSAYEDHSNIGVAVWPAVSSSLTLPYPAKSSRVFRQGGYGVLRVLPRGQDWCFDRISRTSRCFLHSWNGRADWTGESLAILNLERLRIRCSQPNTGGRATPLLYGLACIPTLFFPKFISTRSEQIGKDRTDDLFEVIAHYSWDWTCCEFGAALQDVIQSTTWRCTPGRLSAGQLISPRLQYHG